MSAPKPIGFDNFRAHFFVSRDGSGTKFFSKGSFAVVDSSMHKVFRGPDIAATTAAATITVTTSEIHGLHAGQTIRLHGMPVALAALNSEWVVLTVPSTTTFTLGYDSTADGTTAGVGVVGVAVPSYLPAADWSMTTGRLCVDDYPAAWELPLEG